MSLGFIYKISNNNDNRLYIGSTFKGINERFYQHKSNCRSENRTSSALYVAMREIGEGNFKIEVIEIIYNCTDKDELRKYEQKYIDELKPEFNCQRAHHTAETKKNRRREYEKNRHEEKKLEDKERVKKWHTENKERVKEYKKQHYLKNKAAIAEKSKKYYEANKEHLKEYSKKHAQENPKVSISCECGGTYMTGKKNRHFKTKLHINWVNTK